MCAICVRGVQRVGNVVRCMSDACAMCERCCAICVRYVCGVLAICVLCNMCAIGVRCVSDVVQYVCDVLVL